jgi:hypothetical protein
MMLKFNKDKPMKSKFWPGNHQDGLVTVAALFFLIILTIMGTSAISTSNMEVQIATNDEIHKMTFYAADSGADLGTELVELNIACPNGFATDDLDIGGGITVIDRDFWMQESEPAVPDILIDNAAGNQTNLTIHGKTGFGIGGAIEMAAAYEGKGKAAASGGVTLQYKIHSRHQGYANSESVVRLHWQHVVGNEGTCEY